MLHTVTYEPFVGACQLCVCVCLASPTFNAHSPRCIKTVMAQTDRQTERRKVIPMDGCCGCLDFQIGLPIDISTTTQLIGLLAILQLANLRRRQWF